VQPVEYLSVLCWAKNMFDVVACRYPRHEEEVGDLARQMGFTHVSLSSAIMPMARIVPRGFTGQFVSVLPPCCRCSGSGSMGVDHRVDKGTCPPYFLN